MSAPYPSSTAPISGITSRHFSPTGQTHHIQQPSEQYQYSTIMSHPYPSMNASNLGQARQNTQQITEQHYVTMSISPLPATDMASHSMSQSSTTPEDELIVSRRLYHHYHPNTTPILDSRFPGQTDFPGSSTSAKSFAPTGNSLIANSPNHNTTNQYMGYGVPFHNPPSFHSSYHNTVTRNNIPPSSSLPTPHLPQNVPPNTGLASSSSYPESLAPDFGTQHGSQPAGLLYQPALHMAPSPSIHSQDPSRHNPLVYLSSGRRRKTYTQETPCSSSTTFHCDWLDENNKPCVFKGSLGDLKKHFTSKHLSGAQNALNRCHWQGCEYQKRADPTVHDMRRDSAWRHVREKHLKIKRKRNI
ncbi:uncharacterized protein F5147DRAFT_840930 [Suillus discolor]|uniref:Uncharacterized protein n=1 Tax=Suillus discolor TaxID=1912936 RepID=A0A9P7JMJ1_9AGAM|nr:uncharacterized protein F5147DRAFT_840930 [Suillus discolor]KAG2090741.1 hypothetical protein F5147DRAFT_840930 [Suillus discolor]